jgi:hypothetical protein
MRINRSCRDAANVPIIMTSGNHRLEKFEVVKEELGLNEAAHCQIGLA